MNIQISSDNMSVTPSMKSLVESKLTKLERHWADKDPATILLRVVLNTAPDEKFLVKLDLNLDGELLYTEELGFELETAVVDAINELDRQYKKVKDRDTDKWEKQREEKYLTEQDLEALDEPTEESEEFEEE